MVQSIVQGKKDIICFILNSTSSKARSPGKAVGKPVVHFRRTDDDAPSVLIVAAHSHNGDDRTQGVPQRYMNLV